MLFRSALDEIPNDITRKTPASFEPVIDYVVTKVPRWAFEKFPGVAGVLGTQMQSVGESMAIGRTFAESLQKALRSLEIGRAGLNCDPGEARHAALQGALAAVELARSAGTSTADGGEDSRGEQAARLGAADEVSPEGSDARIDPPEPCATMATSTATAAVTGAARRIASSAIVHDPASPNRVPLPSSR